MPVQFPFSLWSAVAGGGGSNNVSVAHYGGVKADNSASVSSGSISNGNWNGNVTSGNIVVIMVEQANDGWNPLVTDLVQTAGTATIGTVVLDQHVNNSGTFVGLAIWRIPVTGTGSLTLNVANVNGVAGSTANNGANGRAGNFFILSALELANINATPVDTSNTATGSGTTRSSGSITTTAPGIIVYCSCGDESSDYTPGPSDTDIYSVGTGSSTMIGCNQYKLHTGSPNTLTDTTGAVSGNWVVAYVAYKST